MTTPISMTPTQTTSKNKTSHALFVITCIVAIMGVVLISSMRNTAPHVATSTGATGSTGSPQATTPVVFPSVNLEARAAYVYDVRNDAELFSKNGTTVLPLASLTKILTALVAMSDIPSDTTITISQKALSTDGDSGLLVDEQWKLYDLASFMLVVSSNDAATALREVYESATGGSFIAAMNSRAETLSLLNTTLVNETGLDGSYGQETNAGTPRDVAHLLASTLTQLPELFDATRKDSSTFTSRSGTTHVAESTNLLANDIPWSLGAKTGFTDSAGGNLAIAFDVSVGHPIVIVVMGSSRDGRFEDVRKLIEATRTYFQGL